MKQWKKTHDMTYASSNERNGLAQDALIPSPEVIAGDTLDAATSPTPSDIRAGRSEYLYNWDRLRLLAALDPLTLHVTGHHAMIGIGLPMFLVLSVALSVAKPEPPSARTFIYKRFSRIFLPWVFWSFAIAGLRVFFSLTQGQQPFGWFRWPMSFYGPRVHLWFLPFIVVMGLLAHAFHRLTFRSKTLPLSVGLICVSVLLAWIPPQFDNPWPFDQWVFSLPALTLGLAVGRTVASQRDLASLRFRLLWLFILYAGLGAGMWVMEPVTKAYLIRFGGGLLLLVFATWLPNRADQWTKSLVPLMLGLYVLHPAVYALAIKPLMFATGTGPSMWLRVVLTLTATAVVVAILRKTFLRRVL